LRHIERAAARWGCEVTCEVTSYKFLRSCQGAGLTESSRQGCHKHVWRLQLTISMMLACMYLVRVGMCGSRRVALYTRQ
jgi:hypothetical protein